MSVSKYSRKNRSKLTAVVVSLGIHAAFIMSSSVFRIPGVVVPPSTPQQLFQVKIARHEALNEQQSPQMSARIPQQKFRFESPLTARNIDSFLEQEKEASKDKQELVLDQQIEQIAQPSEEMPLIASKETIDYDFLRSPQKKEVSSDLANAVELNVEDIIDNAKKVVSRRDLDEEFIDKMPGFTPSLLDRTFDVSQEVEPLAFKERQMPAITRMKEVEDLESELVWTLGVYQDPRDQQKYFKITIRVGEENKKLKTNNKEVQFLIDCSQSVEDDRLQEFKEGIIQGLKLMNEGDLFNIIVFKELIFEFREESVPPSQANIDEAIRFLEQFRTAEKTDAFEVLVKTIRKEPKATPSYIILLSDGRPTKGVTNPREVINKISQLNNGKKSIFTLSGGLRVNRYLLDFIAYKNRGWSEYSYRSHLIGEQLTALYEKIDDPIILNLRYYMSGMDEEETFPNILPDFFRHAEFTLYGKYDKEDEFVMQLLGEVEGKTKEYILKSDFSRAYQGDEEIARNWAYNKLFHLISELEYDKDNTPLIEEINKISEKFDLKTPYLEDIIQ